MKTIKKLQVATAVASLFAVSGVATAATLNSSGSTFAAETIFPGSVNAPVGNNTKVKAPAYTYQYEGGVTAASRQIFKVAVNLTGGAQWARDTTRVGDPFLPFFQTDGRQAATIVATATVNGQRGRVAVLNNADPGVGQFALRLNRIEAGDTIVGSPLQSSALSAVTYVFELVNATPNNGLTLEQLALQFSTYKDAGVAVLPGSATDTPTTSLDQYPTIYNLASLSVDTANGTCAVPQGAIRLQAVSGNNDPAVLSQEDFNSNQGTLRDVGNYILIRRATDVALAKRGDRLVQTTNSFQTNFGSSPVNGIGGTGGGRFTFKPSSTEVANVYGGSNNGSGLFTVDNTRDAPTNATVNGTGTFAERRTAGDERSAKLGVLTFANIGNPQDRLNDLDPFGFKPGTGTQLPNNASSFEPSDVGAVPRQVGDFTPVTPAISTNGNVYGGVDFNTAGLGAPLSGAVVIQFTSKANFSGFAAPAVPTTSRGLTLRRGDVACTDTVPAGTLTGSLVESPAGSGNYFWRFTNAELAAASPPPPGFATGTVEGPWTVCYNVSGETTIPATTFTNVAVTILKDDTTEQALRSCSASLASIYGGVKIDVRNFALHRALPGANADQRNWFGVLRLINNNETETATVEGQFLHLDGRYGPWGQLAVLAPREARYVFASNEGAPGVYDLLSNPVANADSRVNNAKPTTETARVRISADVASLRVQNYIYHAVTQALTEVSSAQGADFLNIDSSNRDHIDQDAQFDIVKDTTTLGMFQTTVPKTTITGDIRN